MVLSKFHIALILIVIINATFIHADDSSEGDCTVTNSNTKQRFDLNQLTKKSG